MPAHREQFDLAVVGAGILGLACALAAAKRGLRVVVLERNERARGASVRNFGFITVTGQDRETVWLQARRSRDVWRDVAAAAGIPVVQQGLWAAAQRPEAAAVLESFLRTDMADGCRLLSAADARRECPGLATPRLEAVLVSNQEMRVESRTALPALAHWLASTYAVSIRWNTAVHAIEWPTVATSHGPVHAAKVIVCPGDDLVSLFPDRLARARVGRCKLQMLRLESPGFALPGTVLSDLSLVRYGGFAKLPEAQALRRRLSAEQPEYLRYGIHLIVAQSSDGSLVVGDSHDYETAAEPFASESIDNLLLDEYRKVTGCAPPAVRERWSGTYAVADDRVVLIEAPAPDVRLVLVTSGIGASTGFAIGEDVVGELLS